MITLVDHLEQLPAWTQPCHLTIGTFDGVHLGHQAVLQHLTSVSSGDSESPLKAALTFSNHPSEVLRPENPTLFLTSPTFRYQLLQRFGVQHVLAVAFTQQLALLSAESFLQKLRARIPFTRLVLGHDATIGCSREGGRELIEELARKMGFTVDYLLPLQLDQVQVSSSIIRSAVREGRIEESVRWLGRSYCLTGYVIPGHGRGRKLGFPTVNIDVKKLCLPPYGVYAVELLANGKVHRGIANLGLAPTIHLDRCAILEVHLLDLPGLQTTGTVEVVLQSFLRPERKFASLEQLRRQIAADVAAVKADSKSALYAS